MRSDITHVVNKFTKVGNTSQRCVGCYCAHNKKTPAVMLSYWSTLPIIPTSKFSLHFPGNARRPMCIRYPVKERGKCEFVMPQNWNISSKGMNPNRQFRSFKIKNWGNGLWHLYMMEISTKSHRKWNESKQK